MLQAALQQTARGRAVAFAHRRDTAEGTSAASGKRAMEAQSAKPRRKSKPSARGSSMRTPGAPCARSDFTCQHHKWLRSRAPSPSAKFYLAPQGLKDPAGSRASRAHPPTPPQENAVSEYMREESSPIARKGCNSIYKESKGIKVTKVRSGKCVKCVVLHP